MKKLIKLWAILAVGLTPALNVVACGKPKANDKASSDEIATSNLQHLKLTSSNLVKPLIISSQKNFSTNRLLEHQLRATNSNISNLSTAETGKDYQQFVHDWGVNQKIEGFDEKQFLSDTNQNTKNSTAEKMFTQLQAWSSTVNQYVNPQIIEIIKTFFQNNKSFRDAADSQKQNIIDKLWYLKQLMNQMPEINQAIANFLPPLLGNLLTGLTAFNPESYYEIKNINQYKNDAEAIKATLFQKKDSYNNWWENDNDFKDSDSIKNHSKILTPENFQTWDQVALYQAGSKFNQELKKIDETNHLNFSDVFQAATENKWNQDGTEIGDLDLPIFNEKLTQITKNIKEQFMKINTEGNGQIIRLAPLIGSLIPIVKTLYFGIKPTVAFKKLTVTEQTNAAKGIINLKEIVEKTLDILENPQQLAKFFNQLLVKPSATNNKEINNYLLLDITVANHTNQSFAVNQVINQNASKKSIDALTNFTKTTINDTIIRSELKILYEDLQKFLQPFGVKITEIMKSLKVLKMTSQLFDALKAYQKVDDLSTNWVDFLTKIGYQSDQTDFKPDSLLDALKQWFNQPMIAENFSGALKFSLEWALDAGRTFVYFDINHLLDNDNHNFWTIDNSSSKFSYDAEIDKSTLSYQLIANLPDSNAAKSWNITIVSDGNAKVNGKSAQITVKIKTIKQN